MRRWPTTGTGSEKRRTLRKSILTPECHLRLYRNKIRLKYTVEARGLVLPMYSVRDVMETLELYYVVLKTKERK